MLREAYTCRLDRRLFLKSIQHRNTFIKFISSLIVERMIKSPLKRNDIISHLLTVKDSKTNEGLPKMN
jgi:hypothetical protein